MRIKIYILLILPILIFTACERDISDVDTSTDIHNNEISFDIGFGKHTSADVPQTKVSTAPDFTSSWENGDEIGLFACTTGTSLQDNDNPIHNVKLTYNSVSGKWTPATTLYWPGNGKYDFYAYYPYNATVTSPSAIAFNVLTDQSTAYNYAKSDLLTAKSNNSGNGWGKGVTVPLAFNHALAMVQVSIPGGKGWGANENLTVKLRGVKTRTNVNLRSISANAGEEVSLAYLSNDPTSITMCRVEKSTDANYYSSYTYRALVPAQSVAAGTCLFHFIFDTQQLFTDPLLIAMETLTAGQAGKYTRTLPSSVIELKFITAGSFTMGDVTASFAAPPHPVTLTTNYWMSKYEITNMQYATFLNEKGVGSDGQGVVFYGNSSSTHTLVNVSNLGVQWNSYASKWIPAAGFENYPVNFVSWYGAKAFADFYNYSLPTEAQWEYACRAGTTTTFSYGDSANGDYMWYQDNSSYTTHEVGTKLPNAWGLYDMHGNVYEWCSDLYSIYTSAPVTDPDVQVSGYSQRVARGGCYSMPAQHNSSACRSYPNPSALENFYGFRVVMNR